MAMAGPETCRSQRRQGKLGETAEPGDRSVANAVGTHERPCDQFSPPSRLVHGRVEKIHPWRPRPDAATPRGSDCRLGRGSDFESGKCVYALAADRLNWRPGVRIRS